MTLIKDDWGRVKGKIVIYYNNVITTRVYYNIREDLERVFIILLYIFIEIILLGIIIIFFFKSPAFDVDPQR